MTKRALLSACWTRGWPRIGYEHLRSLDGLGRAPPDSINTAWQNTGFRGYAGHMQTQEFEAAGGVDGTRVTYPALA